MTETIDKVKPIVITDTESGKVYTLEFNRKIAHRMEDAGFIVGEVFNKPTSILTLFHGSFMMHQPGTTAAQAEKLWDEIGDKKPEIVNRLCELYNEPLRALMGVNRDGEPEAKNSNLTVDF